MYRLILLLSILSIITTSCYNSEKDERILPSSSGRMNEMVVVMKHDLWKGEVGKKVRSIFMQDIIGLPQPEQLYRVAHIDPNAFTSTFKAARNLIIIKLEDGDNAKLTYSKDVYAKPQIIEEISANTEEALLKILQTYKKDLVKKFHNQDIYSIQKRFKRIRHQNISDIEEKGISVILPKSYTLIDVKDNFWWYRSDIREGKYYPSLNFLLYITPLKSELEINGSSIIPTRDSIGKKYVGGTIDGSYMQTEHRPQFAPVMKNTIFNNNIAIETRGLWMVKGDFMGGPFLSYTIFDEKNKRIITAEGFVYGAGGKKRDFVFEMEAIIKSLKIKK